jgi:hypothetical protein
MQHMLDSVASATNHFVRVQRPFYCNKCEEGFRLDAKILSYRDKCEEAFRLVARTLSTAKSVKSTVF